jgi:3-(methylthio)propanoyl-CoA dehydrogenase
MEEGLADPRNALAGATPYLRMFSLVTAGWLMARQGLAAKSLLDEDATDEFAQAKLVTARFFAEQILPAVNGLAVPVMAGFEDLYAVKPEAISG